MATGTVKFFNPQKGFGFIKEDDTDAEIFVHITGLVDQQNLIVENDHVEYDTEEGKKGLNATNVKKI